MIIFLHLMLNLLNDIRKKRELQQFNVIQAKAHPLAERDAKNILRFDPPMFKQRYERATDLLVHEKWKDQLAKIVDFGSAELRFFIFLKNEIQAKEMLFVDIDELLLRDYLFRLYPLNGDYFNPRPKPLNVKAIAGSISHPDPLLLNTDAVIALEIIEHLYPDVLEALPYNIFGFIRPKIVIVTTPNAEFNVLFKKVDKFRHFDHKFEWTREQFESWCTNITQRFPNYVVQFDGIGLGPNGDEDFGCCSQLAIFMKKDICFTDFKESDYSNTDENSYGICTYNSYLQHTGDNYKVIASIDYPYDTDVRTDEEKKIDEIKYRLNMFGHRNAKCYNYEKNCAEIPLRRLVYSTSKVQLSEQEIRTLLLKLNYKIEECLNRETEQEEPCVIYESDMESGASGSDTEASGYESDKCNLEDWEEQDWNNDEPKNEAAKSQAKPQEALFDSGYQKSPDKSPKEAIALDFKALNDRPNKLSNILSVFDNFDKVNEMDAIRKDRKHFSFGSNFKHHEVMKKICQEIVKPVAGPSQGPRKKPITPDPDDPVEDVKAIATCILENSLNKLEIQDEDEPPELIQLIPPEPVENEPVVLVENGDLANNNRDLEGNNYPERENIDIEPIDNIDNNVNNNEDVVFVEEGIVEDVVEEVMDVEPAVEEVEWPSREALFDDNSQVDLLEEFDFDQAPVVAVVLETDCLPANPNPALPTNDVAFPNWLLQIFEEGEPEDEAPDEAHFYCQGDGLGVHPSTLAVNDDDDDGNESDSETSSSSSSSGSANFQSAENHSFQDVSAETRDSLEVVGQAVVNATEAAEEEEVFENAEESTTNLLSSCAK